MVRVVIALLCVRKLIYTKKTKNIETHSPPPPRSPTQAPIGSLESDLSWVIRAHVPREFFHFLVASALGCGCCSITRT